MVLAKSFTAPHPPITAAPQGEVAAVRIVDPDFCKNQTWPYIDTRCLKRVAPEHPVVDEHPAGIPANSQALAAAPPPASPSNSVPSGTPNGGNISVASNSGTVDALSGVPMTAASSAQPKSWQEMLAPPPGTGPTDRPANPRVADAFRSRRSGHGQHGAFFGFRF